MSPYKAYFSYGFKNSYFRILQHDISRSCSPARCNLPLNSWFLYVFTSLLISRTYSSQPIAGMTNTPEVVPVGWGDFLRMPRS